MLKGFLKLGFVGKKKKEKENKESHCLLSWKSHEYSLFYPMITLGTWKGDVIMVLKIGCL